MFQEFVNNGEDYMRLLGDGCLIGCHIGNDDDNDDEDGNDIYGMGVTLTANWHRLVLMHTLAVTRLPSANH